MATSDSEKYQRRKERLLTDESICPQNRDIFRRFFEYQEYKLKRINRLAQLDAGTIKTLDAYVTRLRTSNTWFENKPWVDLTDTDIRRVYDALEDGKFTTRRGARYLRRIDFYNKVFKSKPFELAGKAELAKRVIEFASAPDSVVRFVLEPEVRRLLEYIFKRPHRLLVWLAFDIGENINSLLVLRPRDFTRQMNPYTSDPEYRVELRREILKRSRTPRSELTNFPDTVRLLDELLPGCDPNSPIFDFGYGGAAAFLTRAADAGKVLCQPQGQPITWKDLRSGMACDLLRKGWSTDEVNARLGHRPSSSEINKYVNFLALDRQRPKAKVQQFEVATVQAQLAETQARERLAGHRLAQMEESLALLRGRFAEVARALELKPTLKEVELAIAIKSGQDPSKERS